MDKLGHVLAQYGALTLVVLACWGMGDALLRMLKIDRDHPAVCKASPACSRSGWKWILGKRSCARRTS